MTTESALRVARHADATGRYPEFSDNPVRQWLVEEALLVRLRVHEQQLEEDAILKQRIDEAEQRVAELRERRRNGQPA